MAARFAARTAMPIPHAVFVEVVVAKTFTRPLRPIADAATAPSMPTAADAASAAAAASGDSALVAAAAAATAAAALRPRPPSLPASSAPIASTRAKELEEVIDADGARHRRRLCRAAGRLLGRVMAAEARGRRGEAEEGARLRALPPLPAVPCRLADVVFGGGVRQVAAAAGGGGRLCGHTGWVPRVVTGRPTEEQTTGTPPCQ